MSVKKIGKMSLLLLLGFCISISFAAETRQDFPPTIKGMVIDEEGKPMRETNITVIKFGSTDILSQTTTDLQGQFYIADVPLVYEYQIWIEPNTISGYPPQYWGQGMNTRYPPADPIKLDYNFIFTVLIELTQFPADTSIPVDNYFGAMEGRLTTENGLPFPNVKVVVTTVNEQNPVVETETDAEGNFLLYHVPSGHPHNLQFIPAITVGYPIQFLNQNNETTLNPIYSLDVFAFDTWMFGDIYLSQNPDTGSNDTTFNGSVKVTLLDSTNNVLKTYGYIALYADWGHVANIHIDPNFMMPVEFHNLPEGNYSVFMDIDYYPPQFYNPDGNTVEDLYRFYLGNNETKQFTTVVTMHPDDSNATPNIKGKVTGPNGLPLRKARISAINKDQATNQQWIHFPNFWADYSVETDDNGEYVFYNMHGGEYALVALVENGNYVGEIYNDVLTFQNAEFITVGNNETKEASFELDSGSIVIGWVKEKKNPNVGIQGLRVNLWIDHDGQSDPSINYETETDQDGKFIFMGIPDNRYHVDVWDQNGIYYRVDDNWEDIEIFGPVTYILKNTIFMEAGGYLYGHFKMPDVNNTDRWNLGRIFLSPKDLSQINDTIEDIYEHHYIGIHKESDSSDLYKTDAIPVGDWRMAVMPQPWFNFDSLNINQNFIPFLKWSYIDNALTSQSTKIITIQEKATIKETIEFQKGGFVVFGSIEGEKGENFGWNSATGMWEKGYHVSVYIKDIIQDSVRFIQVSESYDIRDNRFYLPGLVDGQEYYFEAWAEDYPDQWWVTSTDTFSTAIPDSAKPYTFKASTTFNKLRIYVKENPQGHDPWNEEGPSYLKNFKIKPAGLTSVHLSWSPSPPEDKVEHYVIFRLKNASESLFKMSEDSTHWEPIDENSIMMLVDSFSVANTDTFFVDTTVIPFVKYMYVVFGFDDKGHMGEALPIHIPLSTYFSEITYTTFTNSVEVKPNLWQMVGVCGLDSLTTTTTTGVLEMFTWDETADSSKLYSYYVPRTNLKPTHGVWIYSSETIPLKMSENAFQDLVIKKDAISIRVNQGWNQISSPFPYGVAPPWLDSNYTAWEWIAGENKYIEAKTIKPWKAYWIKSDITKSLPVSHLPAIATKREPSRLRRSIGWELTVSLTGEKSSDPDNFIGTLPKEFSKTIKNTSAEPPQAFGYPHLYFVNGQEKCAKLYAYSSAIPEKKIEWKVGISPSDQAMKITVHNLSSLPAEVGVFWLDNTKMVNLREINMIAVEARGETQYGYIIATANPADIALYTGKFMLRPNYPNPFRRSTTLEFTVPYLWNKDGSKAEGDRQKISLNIYTISGRLVATVFSGYAKVGHHRKVWNGKSNSGRFLTSGLYITRLTGRDFSKSIRMFKVK